MRLDSTYHQHDEKKRRIAQDLHSGDFYAQVAEVVPQGDDPDSTQKRNAILAQNPVHYASTDAHMTGYWVKLDGDPGAPVQPKAAPATA